MNERQFNTLAHTYTKEVVDCVCVFGMSLGRLVRLQAHHVHPPVGEVGKVEPLVVLSPSGKVTHGPQREEDHLERKLW